MNKIRQYFTTFVLIRGLMIAMLGSGFIYLNHWGLSTPLINTFLGLLALYLLLESNNATWFISGAFMGLFWFWWIALSLIHYEMLWAVPIEIFIIMLSYGAIFWSIAKIASLPVGCCQGTTPYAISLAIKSLGLLVLSYIHPFGFDWFKPELLFVESYLGIQKWQFILVLTGIVLSLWRNKFLFLSITLLAYQPTTSYETSIPESIALITTHTSVEDKWDKSKHQAQFDVILRTIDQAIADKKKLIILPESVFPIFLNRSSELLALLEKKAQSISIIVGALYWDGETPRNSTYIFSNGKTKIANKVLLVPFGEANPLPDFLSDWVNRVFYDNAIDYKADSEVTDYTINGVTYRNAICFEATSEKLYEKDKNGEQPKNMIVLSNNGWFHPSVESTLQKLLLQYYSKKYDTTIYHSVNMSESYVIQNGVVKRSIY
jgi:apolipoprotein N-acyltransferase